jgi:proline iminopeptidase
MISSEGTYHFTARDGVRLWYARRGVGESTPVIFLHGGPGEGSQTFRKFAGPDLESRLTMIYLDQRGSGWSDRPKNLEAYSIRQMVEDIEQLRENLGVQQIDILGHSFGTILALEYAAQYHDHVSRMVLVGSAPDMPGMIDNLCRRLESEDSDAYARAVKARDGTTFVRCNPFEAYDENALKAFFDRNMFPDLEIARQVDAVDCVDGLGNSGESTEPLIAQGLFLYKFEKFNAVNMPVLLIAGDHDFQTPIDLQEALVRQLPDATLIIYAGSGHFMYVEQPKRFAKDVSDFLLTTVA